MQFRRSNSADIPALAAMNWQLIRDEGHSNPMSLPELEQRMRSWLEAEYSTVLFEQDGETVGYALFRPAEDGFYLRQFFIIPAHRRLRLGRQAIGLLREHVWPRGARITVEVLVHNDPAIQFWRAIGFCDYAMTLKLDAL